MAVNHPISPSDLRQLLRYDPNTGKLFWLSRRSAVPSRSVGVFNAKCAGKEAFTFAMATGHLQGRIYGKGYLAHRVIWALVHGEWPIGEIDHINGDPRDNTISNLRDVSHHGNMCNRRRPTNNKSGVVGIIRCRQTGLWRAEIKVNGQKRWLGRFTDFGDAVRARQEAETAADFHPNHGRR